MKSRRHFLKCCTALLGGAALPGLDALAAGPAANPTGFAAFAASLDSVFELVTESGRVLPVLLSKVEIYQPPHRPGLTSEENFNAHFTSRDGAPLKQGTYMFRHPVMGEIPLFVVPHKEPSAGSTDYVATFHGSAVAA